MHAMPAMRQPCDPKYYSVSLQGAAALWLPRKAARPHRHGAASGLKLPGPICNLRPAPYQFRVSCGLGSRRMRPLPLEGIGPSRLPRLLALPVHTQVAMKVQVLEVLWHTANDKGKSDPVMSIDFTFDRLLASGGADKEVKVREVWPARAGFEASSTALPAPLRRRFGALRKMTQALCLWISSQVSKAT